MPQPYTPIPTRIHMRGRSKDGSDPPGNWHCQPGRRSSVTPPGAGRSRVSYPSRKGGSASGAIDVTGPGPPHGPIASAARQRWRPVILTMFVPSRTLVSEPSTTRGAAGSIRHCDSPSPSPVGWRRLRLKRPQADVLADAIRQAANGRHVTLETVVRPPSPRCGYDRPP